MPKPKCNQHYCIKKINAKKKDSRQASLKNTPTKQRLQRAAEAMKNQHKHL